MTCAESRLLLHAHTDRELDAANALELERHLKTCPACAADEKSINSLKATMRHPTMRYEAPESLRKEVRRIVTQSGGEARPRLLQSLLLWKSLAFGATAFALLALALRPGTSGSDQLADEAVSSHVRSLMARHLTDVASSDQHTVKPWFSDKLDFAPVVNDFTAEGFPLLGERLDYFNGRPVAALVYHRNKHFINVFVWPAANTSSGKTMSTLT